MEFPPASEPLAQAVEHLPFKQRVAGSNPARLTIPSPSSSLAQDTGLSRRQHGFESRRGRQTSFCLQRALTQVRHKEGENSNKSFKINLAHR